MTRDERIAVGRVRFGVGTSTYLSGNVQHLVSPLVGMLRLMDRDGETPDAETVTYMIDRLSLVLDLARESDDADQKDENRPAAWDVALEEVFISGAYRQVLRRATITVFAETKARAEEVALAFKTEQGMWGNSDSCEIIVNHTTEGNVLYG